MNKKFFTEKINTYFFLMSLALTVSAFLWLSDANSRYISRVNILLLPKNAKTSIYLNDIKENLVEIFKEKVSFDNDAIIKSQKGNTILKIEVSDRNKQLALDLSQENLEKFLSVASKYYDIKNDLKIEIISRSTIKERGNNWNTIFISLTLGVLLAFIIQVLLDFPDKTFGKEGNKREFFKKDNDSSKNLEKELKTILKLNKEKIEKLSKNIYSAKTKKESEIEVGKEIVDDEKIRSTFKKASSPINLPIDTDNADLQKNIILPNKEKVRDEVSLSEEPSDEEYKKRLNQLLGE